MTNRMLEFCTSGSVGGLGGQPPRPTRPLAQWVFERWNVAGLTVYKFGLVGLVVVLGEVIERHRRGWGRAVVLFGCAAAALVYVQGLRLWLRHG